MTPQIAAGLALIIVLLLLTSVWLVQLRTRDAGLVDVVWSAAIGIIALFYAAVGGAPYALRVLLAIFAGLWALRLATYLFIRIRGAPEDRRYAQARIEWGKRANLYLLLFFWLQAFFAWILSLPLLVVAYQATIPATGWIVMALLIWIIAMAGEALADYQLLRFKRDPTNHGKVMDRGLWRYSRHPNYFFETLHWVAYIPLAAGADCWWGTLFGPLIMAWLLIKVSGIPTVESEAGSASREGYADYAGRTSAFIPWPPSTQPRGR